MSSITDAIGYYNLRIEQQKAELARLAKVERDGNYVGMEVMACHMEIAYNRDRIREIYAGLSSVKMPGRGWRVIAGNEA